MPRSGQLLRLMLVAVIVCIAAGAPRGALATGRTGSTQHAAGLTISPNAGPPGSLVTLSAPPGSLPAGAVAVVNFQDATAAYAGLPIGQGTVNGDGSINFPVNVLAVAAAGPARIFVTANGATISSIFTVQPGLIINPPSAPRGTVVQITGSGFSPNGLITIQFGAPPAAPLPATALGNESIIANLFGTFTTYVVVPRLPPGLYVVTVSDSTFTTTAPFLVTAAFGAPTPLPVVTFPITATGSATVPPTATPVAAAATPTATAPIAPITAYFAEGYTGQAASNGRASFDEGLNILNPGAVPAPITITYYVQGASAPIVVSRMVPQAALLRESVNLDVGPDKLVAAQISSPRRIYVTRTIDRAAANGGRLDGSATQPAAAPGTNWAFPEGYTGFTFQEYLTLLNPGQAAATVSITLAPQASSAAGARLLHLTVPPQSRITANVTALNAGSGATSVGMLVSSDLPIVAERVIYFGDGSGSGKFGSTVSAGIPAPATRLWIAALVSGGAAPLGGALQAVGDQAYITLLNPSVGGTAVTVTASLKDAIGRRVGFPATVSVAPGTRQTIAVNPLLGTLPVRPLSVTLQATGPIEAEAAQYYGGSPNLGSHPGVAFAASPTLTADAVVPDLSTALVDGTPVNRVVYLYNPGIVALQVRATYFGRGGNPVTATYSIPAGGVTTAAVNSAVQGLPPGPIGGEFTLAAGSGGFLVYSVGRTADGFAATEDVGTPAG